jgi:hypothetical protein
MSSNLIGELVANNGTYYLGSGTYEANIDQIIVRGDSVVISKIYVIRNEELTEVTEEYLYNNNVPNGLRITPKNDEVFVRVELGGLPSIGIGVELVLA